MLLYYVSLNKSTMITNDIGVFPLFAWPLLRTNLRNLNSENNEILNIVQTEPLRQNQSNLIHNDVDILERPQLAALRKDIMDMVDHYAFKVLAYKDVTCELQQSWINVTPPGTEHTLHWHTNAMISGTYYPFGVDKSPIIFHNPNRFQIVPNTSDIQDPMSMISRNCLYVTPSVGELMLWMSPLPHHVRTNEGEQDRISVSFNIMLRGYVGHVQSLSGVSL